MTFEEALQREFPGSIEYQQFLFLSASILGHKNFNRNSTIALVSQCRDELTKPFIDCVEKHWGLPFCLSSLAGAVLCGKTALRAGIHHAPTNEDGIDRFLFLAGPHIAISGKGVVGEVMREGRSTPSSACGSLSAVLSELRERNVKCLPDGHDKEQERIKEMLVDSLRWGEVPSLSQLTKKAREGIEQSLKDIVAMTVDPINSHYAVITGVLIHGPDQRCCVAEKRETHSRRRE